MHQVLENPKPLQQDFKLLEIQFPISIFVDVLDDVKNVFYRQIQAQQIRDDGVHLVHRDLATLVGVVPVPLILQVP